MLVHMYLQLYVLALKQPFKDHLPVVLECFHHLLSALLLLYSLWIFWRDSSFYVLRSRALDRGSALCSHHCCYSFPYIFFIFFSVFSFLFSVVAVCCLYKASNLVVYHIRTLLFPAFSHFAPSSLVQVRQSVGFCCNCLIKKIEASNEQKCWGHLLQL